MKTITKTILFMLFLLSSQMSFSQLWTEKVTSEKPTFKEIQSAFYDYWKDRPIEKGQGYKPFKRWEWFTESRLLPNGDFPSSSITWDEFQKYYSKQNFEKQSNTQKSAQSNANWTFKGPSTTPGGYNGLGRINCMAFHPTNPNIFWIGTPAGGLWKTITGGASWTTNTDNLPVLGISDIAVNPTNANIMYVATGDGEISFSLTSIGSFTAGDTKSIGILKSTDGGTTWNTTGLNWNVTSQKLIRRLIINPSNPQILIAAASDGIWRSTDSGTTWSNVQSGYFMDLEYKPGDPTIVYAATYNNSGNAQIYRSINSGATWSLITTLPNVTRINLAVSANSPTLVDALCTKIDQGLAGLWYSSNSGASFTQYYNSDCANNLLKGTYNASGCGGQGNYDLAYAINPNNVNDIWLGGVNTWNSTDGGNTWFIKTMWNSNTSINPNNVPVVHADKHFIAFHPLLPGTIFECNDGGLYKTTNSGASWTDLSNGLQISQIYRVGASQTVDNNIICGLQDNGSREIYNNNWYEQTGGDGMECIIDYSNANTEYASYANGVIYRTNDFWANQTTISANIPGGQQTGAWITPFVIHPSNPNILFAGYDKLYKSTNQGNSWVAISPVLDVSLLYSIAVSPSNTNVIYAASQGLLFKTINGGANWTSVSFAISNVKISYIAVDPTNSQKVYITLSGYSSGNKVIMSSDGGTNWINYSGTLPNVPVNCIVYQNGSNEGLYIGTDLGVFYTDGTMSDWVPYQTGLPNVIVTELEISYNNNKLWAATFGRGLWNSDLFVPLSVPEQEIYNQIIVSPNPNNGLFNIEVPPGKTYSLIVYDIQGKKVYEEQSINTEQKNIDLTKNSSGIYLLNFIINGKSYNKKIIKN